MHGRRLALVFVAAATAITAACARDPNENNPWRVTKLDGGGGGDAGQLAAIEPPPRLAWAAADEAPLAAAPTVTTAVAPPTTTSHAAMAAVLHALGTISLARCRGIGSGSTSGSVALTWHTSGKLVGVHVIGFTPAECACAEKVLWGAKLPSWPGKTMGTKVTL